MLKTLCERRTIMSEFTPIEISTWPAYGQFYYYTEMAPTSYSVTRDIDVTRLRAAVKARGIKFFPAYLYAVTKVIGGIKEFRIGLNDGILGIWDSLIPAYPQYHDDDETTSLLWTEVSGSFSDFYSAYLTDRKDHGESHGILSSKGIPPKNSYIISCIPWFTFESFSLHNHGIKDYYFPSFEAGAFKHSADRVFMPLSATVHHATVDGHTLKCFYDGLDMLLAFPESWLDK